MQFLDYIIASESAIQAMVESTTESSSADSIAEMKRLQDELLQEIPVLREKIATELQPPQQQAQQQAQVQSANDEDKDQIQKAIQLLQSWADESGTQMEQASASLLGSNAKTAIPKQDAALEALDRIWNAIVDFQSLLSKELEAQTKFVNDLEPLVSSQASTELSTEQNELPHPVLEADLSKEAQEQQRILMKAMLLAPKAEAELNQMESQPTAEIPSETALPEAEANDAPAKVDPEEIKKGLRLAVELAPKAVEQMESSVQELKKKNRNEAKGFSEEAKRILKEISDAQPKDPNQQKDKDQNQQNQEEKKNDEQEPKEQDKKSEQDKNDKDNQDKDKDKDNDKENDKSQENKDQNDKSGIPPKPNEVSKDRMEEALRKVKEREQEKRERDRELKARILGRSPVEKDW
jgi:hypothetical protein